MKFAIKTAPMNTTWPDMLEVWKAADQIDLFETAWNFDHFEPIFSDRSGPCLEGWTMLAAMVGYTSRIRLGCQVTGMPYRHPSVLANMAATIDIASGGRLDIGLGAGWNQDESDALGIPLAPMKERFEQFREGVATIVALMSSAEGARTTLKGKHFNLTEAWFEPKSIQRPHPPIAIGGNGEKKTLRLVAEYAQHWNSTLSDVVEWQRKSAVLDQHCAGVGRNPEEIERSINILCTPTTPPSQIAETAQMWSEAGADIAVIGLRPPLSASVLGPIAETLRDTKFA
jgi:F420-dependent oxidoreductase-like protein